ncbi:MAG: HRDC domain-containing protein [Myxococcota bacterium]|nr:HRDC domain-containing protein [Myxococcota bacterium]
MADFKIIDRLSDLEALAKDLGKEDVIAVDTEADSFYHYFDKTCLVQIATRKNSYLIDPLALGGPAALAPLAPVFASSKIRKIFHAAEYDIFVLKRDCGFAFSNLYDTMVSAQLLGYPSIGLAALIEHHFGIKVPKDEQRSDWSRRPLTDKQLKYAAGDVLYLLRLTSKLEKALRHADRLSWAQEEFEALTRREWPEREFDTHGHIRIKGAKKLEPKALQVLRELYLMRDKRAREIDRPTFKVLGNRTLLELAETRPKRLSDLNGVKGVTDLIVRRMGHDILEAVKKGRTSSRSPAPKPPSNGRKRIDRKTERLVNRLKRWRAARAQELELDPGVLCPNASLEAIAWKNPEKPADLKEVEELKGWFVKEFGSEIVALVRRDEHLDETATDGAATKAPASKSAAESPERGKKRRRRKKKRGTRQADPARASSA